MSARAALIALTLLAVPFAGCASDTGPGTTVTVTEDFEKGIDHWETLVAAPPGVDASGLTFNATVQSGDTAEGDFALNLTIDAPGPNGTVWIQRPMRVEANQAYAATVTLQARDIDEAPVDARLVVRLGTDPAVDRGDFPPPGTRTTAEEKNRTGGLNAPIEDGWSAHEFGWHVPARDNRTLHAAIGILGTEEGRASALVDDVTIVLERLASEGEDGGDGAGRY